MTTELTILAWALLLAILQIALAGALSTRERGIQYNMSARDGKAPEPGPVTARVQRALANLLETLPLFAAAVLAAHVAGREGALTVLGCQIYLAARVIYVPLYAFGVPALRSLVWLASMAGLLMILVALLR